jgi:hypothetical protein
MSLINSGRPTLFEFTPLIDTDQEIVSKPQNSRKKLLGIPITKLTKKEIARLKTKVCHEVIYLRKGLEARVRLHDIVFLSDGEMGPVTKIFADGLFCIGKRKVLFKLKDIAINITLIQDYEQNLNSRNRFWYASTSVEVFSNSQGRWCPGKIEKVFQLKSADPLVAHTEKWYSLSYKINGQTKYKQLPWHSRFLRSPKAKLNHKFCERRLSSAEAHTDDDTTTGSEIACDDSAHSEFHESPSFTVSSMHNSIFE